MAFLNKKTGYYYTEKKLLGFGRLPRTSLGTKRKGDASKFEAALVEIDRRAILENPAYHQLVRAFLPGHPTGLTAAQLYLATQTDGLDELMREIADKPFEDVLADYKVANNLTYTDSAIEEILLEYIAENLWSEVCRATFLDTLYTTIEKDRAIKPNSVLRNYGRLLSKMIEWKEGKRRRDDLFAKVKYQGADDTRRLRRTMVTRAAIGKLMQELIQGYQKEGDECAVLYAAIAISQGVTPAVLPRCLNSDFQVMSVTADGDSYRVVTEGGTEVGLLELRGTKSIHTKSGTKRRDRPIWIAKSILDQVTRYWRQDLPDEPLFPLRSSRFYTIFKKARDRAGLSRACSDDSPLRPHDLRSIFAFLAEEEGINRSVIGFGGLGHTNLKQTDRYLARETMMSPFAVGQILERIEVETPHFRK